MIDKLIKKIQKTRFLTQKFRADFALNRASAGFSNDLKDITFTLLSDKSKGAFIYDVDGNQYIDLTMGFGSIFFGHNHSSLRNRIIQQLKISWSVGPISPLAAQLASKINQVTGNERTAFFNSGTEAVMVALRLAKAGTKKNKIVFFKGSYHGTFDSLLSIKSDSQTKIAQEIIPGVTQSILNESILLDYGKAESLTYIKEHIHEIAGVLVEPVQSRNPALQPVEFLKELAQITEKSNIALIFDEVITGFRIGLGGAQEYFGIRADIVTYGKVIGGGMPIGVVSGAAKYLDITDGGVWTYGDDSFPTVKQTFVAGTFCHHPLAMASALKTIELLEKNNAEVYELLNSRTEKFCNALNAFFQSNHYPLSVSHFASLFRFTTPGKTKLLYNYMLLHGIYVWEGRNCFLSSSHSDTIIQKLEKIIQKCCFQMEKDGVLVRRSRV
ncbi:MAG: aminotransferase class III-fold pyridoxal phosphate-dependent enzyme [Cryomorphaceae bacterium]|nr:aminotransferase class III-fold pyridoxal phosphate-dependent enzyme [Cryomorphaceae bacterium]